MSLVTLFRYEYLDVLRLDVSVSIRSHRYKAIRKKAKDPDRCIREDDITTRTLWRWPRIVRFVPPGLGMANGRIGRNSGQRLRIGSQLTNLGLGSYPAVTLASARERAVKNAQSVAEGGDPRTPVATIPTFADAVDAVISVHSEGWKHPKTAKRWRATLDTYPMPVLANHPVSEITTSHVMEVLTPIWLAKPETGKKVREPIGVVMKWSIAQGFRADNPAGDAVTRGLPKSSQRVEHHRALPFAEVGEAVRQVRATDAWPSTTLAFELLTLTACRSSEIRLADWSEFDLDGATWTIPATRTKNGLEHRVPLSDTAMDVLRTVQDLSDGSGLVFPSQRGKTMSDSTLSKLLRENKIACVPHGMRTSFRTWAAECSDVPREIAEHALAHVEGSAAELAYRRTDYFERRRVLMQDWADFLNCQV